MKLKQMLLEGSDTHPEGVMVAFMIDRPTARRLVQPGGEAVDELHLTLAYLGKSSELDSGLIDDLERVCAELAGDSGPLEGEVVGAGRFEASASSDDKDVIYAAVAVPGLKQFRRRLVSQLKRAGAEPSTKFEFNPHITLAYVDPDEPGEPELDRIPLRFRKLTLSVGDRRRSFTLAAGKSSS